jgi:hypothetical protein
MLCLGRPLLMLLYGSLLLFQTLLLLMFLGLLLEQKFV